MASSNKSFQTPTNDSEKKDFLQQAIDKIEKEHGKGSIMKLGDNQIVPVEVISTDCLTLDLALGIEIGRASCRERV